MRILTQLIATLATISVAACGVAVVAWAAPSQLHQDIFASDCTETTIHTGSGITTAYGCPEPPTIETQEQLIPRSPMVFEGWFDVLNKQSLKVTFSNGREYVLGVDPQLSVSGDRWELRLTGVDVLPPGSYTMTVSMGATNGATVVVSKTFVVSAPVQPIDSSGGAGVGSSGSSGGGILGKSQYGDTSVEAAAASTGGGVSRNTSGDAYNGSKGDGRIVSDASTPLIEQFRRVVMSYANPSWRLTFIASALFFGYVFYLLGRHYRHIEEEHSNQLRALKRATRRKNAKPKQVLHHAVGTHKKRHA